MQSLPKVKIALTFYAFTVLFLAIRSYPPILNIFSEKFSKNLHQPLQYISPSWIHDLSTESFKVSSLYREDISHTGVNRHELSGLKFQHLWSFKPLNVGIHGASKSSPAVDNSGIYLGTDSGYFLAINHDGQLKWKVFLPDSFRGIHSTPLLTQDTVFFGAYNGVLYALDKATGRVRWIKNLGHAIGSSPVIYNSEIYISVETSHPNGYLVKLRAQDGELMWVTNWLGEQSHSTPTLWPEKNLVFVGANSSIFYAFDMNNGKKVWSRKLLGEVKSTSALVDGVIYVTSWGRRLQALDALTGQLIWETHLSSTSQSSPTVIKELNIVLVSSGAGEFIALNAQTGKKIWEKKFDVTRYITSPLAVQSKNKIWITWTYCSDQKLCALDIQSGKLLSELKVSGDLTGVPVIFNQHLFVATDGIQGDLSAYKMKESP